MARKKKTPPAAGVQNRAMLADLSLRYWEGRKYDRQVSDAVATQYHAEKDAGRYNKRLIAKDTQKEINRVWREVTDYHFANTLPWLTTGTRIFPATLYFDYITKMRTFEAQYNDAADKFTTAYPQLVADAKLALNGLFKDADYPPPAQIRDRFSFKLVLLPLPDAADFRVALGDEELARLQADFLQTQNELLAAAIHDVIGRIKDVVERMAERLRAYGVDADGKAHHVFRDSLVTNISELVAILPALNITEDAALSDLIDRVRMSLTTHDAVTLRDNAGVREIVAAEAEAILAHVNSFFA